MPGHSAVANNKASPRPPTETHEAASSQSDASRKSMRLLLTVGGFVALMLILLSVCVLRPLSTHASAKGPRLVPEGAFLPSLPAFVTGGIRPGRHPGSRHARPIGLVIGPGRHTGGSRPRLPFFARPGVQRWPPISKREIRSAPRMSGPPADDSRNSGYPLPGALYKTGGFDLPVHHSPKCKEYSPRSRDARLSLKSGASVLPHPEKADRTYKLPPHCGGEDAYFVDEAAGVIGVADGVGGWASIGVDPGIYSRQLMHLVAEEVKASTKEPFGSVDPGAMLQRAHSRTTAEGSSTALVLAFAAGSGQVRVANLGDSGFLHLRCGKVLFQSPSQQHGFNYPFQLASPNLAMGDPPNLAEIFELDDIATGDVIVVGTDGLFDNASGEDIAAIVHRVELSGETGAPLAESAANQVAQQTALWAKDKKRKSPFALEAAKVSLQYRLLFSGGKLDDITVVVAVVVAESEQSAESRAATSAPRL